MHESERLAQLPPKTGGLTAMTGAMALIVVLLVVQIWLLSAALESFLAARRKAALPAAIFSGILFVICFALYVFVDRIDAGARHPRRFSRQRRGYVQPSGAARADQSWRSAIPPVATLPNWSHS